MAGTYNRYVIPKERYRAVTGGGGASERPSAGSAGGLRRLLGGLGDLVPSKLDPADLLLLAILYLLYLDSGDEEFLLLLAVMAFGILRPQ